MSNQFTDSSNAVNGNLSGVIGEIPSYEIADLAFSHKLKRISYEIGINNLFNEKYFTRRATGNPGPGGTGGTGGSGLVIIRYKYL